MKLKANFHTHTTFCDGASTPREMAQAALALGFDTLGFSGHMDMDVHMDLPAYLAALDAVKSEFQGRLSILKGIELDVLYDPACAAGLDYVIGSTHFLDVPYERTLSVDSTAEDLALLCDTFFGGDYYALSRDYYRLEATVFDRTHCTFVGHFDLVTKFNARLHAWDETSPRYLGPALEAMEYLVSRGVPFEINTKQCHLGKLCPGPVLLRSLRDMGGELLISSDAHRAADLNRGFDMALQAARAAGFDHVNVLSPAGGKTILRPVGIGDE